MNLTVLMKLTREEYIDAMSDQILQGFAAGVPYQVSTEPLLWAQHARRCAAALADERGKPVPTAATPALPVVVDILHRLTGVVTGVLNCSASAELHAAVASAHGCLAGWGKPMPPLAPLAVPPDPRAQRLYDLFLRTAARSTKSVSTVYTAVAYQVAATFDLPTPETPAEPAEPGEVLTLQISDGPTPILYTLDWRALRVGDREWFAGGTGHSDFAPLLRHAAELRQALFRTGDECDRLRRAEICDNPAEPCGGCRDCLDRQREHQHATEVTRAHGKGQEDAVATVARALGCEATIGAVEAKIAGLRRKVSCEVSDSGAAAEICGDCAVCWEVAASEKAEELAELRISLRGLVEEWVRRETVSLRAWAVAADELRRLLPDDAPRAPGRSSGPAAP